MYTLIDLGDFDGGGLMALNSNRQCVGWANNVPGSSAATDSFLLDGEHRINLGHLDDELMTIVRGLNAFGEAVGYTESFDKEEDAFLWRDGAMTVLPSLGGHHSAAYAINDAGLAVGFSYSGDPADPYYSACVWQGGAVTALGNKALGASPVGEQWGSIAFAVNAQGWVAGDVLGRSPNLSRACVWRDGQQVTLSADLPPERRHDQETFSHASAINDVGQIVGRIGLGWHQARSCLWEAGGVRLIEGLDSHHGMANGINIHGQVVGMVYMEGAPSAPSCRAYVWEDGRMTDLTTVLRDGDGWTLTAASGINDAGQIIASGEYRGEQREVLLVPCD